MTKLDPSVQSVKAIMILPRREFSSECPLPEGYTYEAYDDSMKDAWCRLHTSTGLFSCQEEAADILQKMIEEDRSAFEKQFVFVCDANKNLVASCGLWKGNHFGMERVRLHYVSVLEEHQHQKIGQSMIVHAARMYDAMPSKYPLYVVSQASSYGAIKLYSRLGFTPYLGVYQDHTKEQSEKDWEYITDVLRKKA